MSDVYQDAERSAAIVAAQGVARPDWEAAKAGWTARMQDPSLMGQVATQYVDETGRPTMDIEYNPNGSALAIESLTSPDGRVLGKMAHAERYASNVWKNVPGGKDMQLFQAGVDYFR